MIKVTLISLMMTIPAFAVCPKSDDFTAQMEVRQLLNKTPDELFEFSGMTKKQIGDEHWYIRVKLFPWSNKIKDGCVREQVVSYLQNELDAAQEKAHPNNGSIDYDYNSDPRVDVDKGEEKARNMKWPDLPK